jgi:hypothetical protein
VLWLIAGTAFALLAACSTHRAVEKKAPPDPEWWLATLDDAMDRYTDMVLKSCPPQGFLSNDKCIKAKILEGFAMQGSAGTHCRTDEPSGGFLLCVDLFTSAERIYRRLGLDPQSAMDWDDPYESYNTLSQVLESRLTSKCGGPSQGDCVSREIADMLAVKPSEADRCVLSSDVKKQAVCAIALIRIDGYRSALESRTRNAAWTPDSNV